MMEKVEAMVKKAKAISEVIKDHSREIRIVSHYDCDGICSAAIMARALSREDKYYRLSFVNQLLEDKVKEISRDPNRLFVFTDLGSGQLRQLQRHLVKDGRTVIIADHHQVQGEVVSNNTLHINPADFEIDGNIAGSGIAYLLARAMDPKNRDLSELAVIGAIGDSQINSIGPDWGLFGLNKEILKDAEVTRKIRITKGLRIWGKKTRAIHKALEYSVDPFIPGVSGTESGAVRFLHDAGISIKKDNGEWRTISDLDEEEVRKLASAIIKERACSNLENPEWIFGDVYELLDKKDFSDANEFATLLNAAGKQDLGYMGVALCLNCPGAMDRSNKILDSYRKEIGKALGWFYSNPAALQKRDFGNYLMAGDSISEHVISNVISVISKSDTLGGPDKPVFALVNTEDGNVKVSARMSDGLVERGLSLQDIITEIIRKVGGEGGGHKGAAGAVIPKGKEEEFIKAAESMISKGLEKAGKADEAEGEAESQGASEHPAEEPKASEPEPRKTGWEKYLGSG